VSGSKTDRRSERGRTGEDAALRVYEGRGFALVARNWRCRLGEIDLIAQEGAVVVFAEVRMRSGSGFGGAAESVTAAKRSRLIAAARLYLAGRPQSACRFDVFVVDGTPASVRWIRDAFGE
jgi:putative endonuclease